MSLIPLIYIDMSENKDKNKAIEYPVIYSYIYEREKEDIERLAKKFKVKVRKSKKLPEGKVIVGYLVEDGEAKPIYKDKIEVNTSQAKITPTRITPTRITPTKIKASKISVSGSSKDPKQNTKGKSK
jgi:uncharacterized protein YydD (DUF2326 family)